MADQPVRRNNAPTAEEIYFSYWSWNLLKDCPHSFYLNVIAGVDRPPTLDKGNAIQGSVPHAQSEDFFRLPLNERDMNFFLDTFDKYWQKVLADSHIDWIPQGVNYLCERPEFKNLKLHKAETRKAVLAKFTAEQIKEIGYREKYAETKQHCINLMKLVASLELHKRPALTEVPFRVTVEPLKHHPEGGKTPALTIGGRIDLIVKMPDGTEEIWDVKGVKDPKKLDIDQLIIYRMGRRAAGNVVSRLGYLLVKQGKPQAERVVDAHEVTLRKMMRTIGIYVKQGDWPANFRTWRCGYCDVRDSCKTYQVKCGKDEELKALSPGKVQW